MSAAGTALVPQISRADSARAASGYPRTDAEISAKVTPTNTDFPPGNVRRYRAGDGHTRDEMAFQNAVLRATMCMSQAAATCSIQRRQIEHCHLRGEFRKGGREHSTSSRSWPRRSRV